MAIRAHIKAPIEPPKTLHTTAGQRLPTARSLRIEESEGGFLLLRLSSDGQFAGDTWHESLRAAQRQAEFEFGVATQDWQEAEQ